MKPHNVRGWAVAACLPSAALLAFACSSSQKESMAPVSDKERSDVLTRLDQSTQLIGQFRPGIPDAVAARAECVLVLPEVKQGGLVVGGMGGKGFATCMQAGAWSPPAPIKIGGGSLGAQIGFQSADVMALLTSDRAEKTLTSGNLKVGADVSASAGPVGTGRGTSGDVTVTSEVMSYARSSGLFAGATLNGTTVSADEEGIRALYGNGFDLASILRSGQTLPMGPEAVKRFEATMATSFAPSTVGGR
jgi:lipid-binding SYLF domain-containing protein